MFLLLALNSFMAGLHGRCEIILFFVSIKNRNLPALIETGDQPCYTSWEPFLWVGKVMFLQVRDEKFRF